MRQSRLLIPTLREIPSDAETASHQLMLRAGLIRQLAAGIYTYLPLGYRVLRKVEQIVREEMDRAGAQELLMPALQPVELWKESGRYTVYGPELIRLTDRHDREFALGPTHEEIVTSLVRDEVNSYRKLPMTLYQIQTKFRDERRPRFGLLRGREFLMKDAYSFDMDWSGLDRSYDSMYGAYHRIFERCGMQVKAVQADAGAIGGEGGTHEFMALAEIGEDTIASCPCCDYAANLEQAACKPEGEAVTSPSSATAAFSKPELVHTPDIRTIEQLSDYLSVPAESFIKTLIYKADGREVAVLVRGDHEVNETKLRHALGAEAVELADGQTAASVMGAPVGFAGPVGLTVPVLADYAVAAMDSAVTGANQADYHLSGVRLGQDFVPSYVGDLRNVVQGAACPACSEGRLELHRGIEIGHVFKLGTKYSEKLGASYLDAEGREQPMIMGCYGIGISRILSAVVEQKHDAQGILWPASMAPFQVHLIPVSLKDEHQMQLAEELYEQLKQAGIEVLLDDRDERPGSKFNDADLIGCPYRIVVGKQAEQGIVEFKLRSGGEVRSLKKEDVLPELRRLEG